MKRGTSEMDVSSGALLAEADRLDGKVLDAVMVGCARAFRLSVATDVCPMRPRIDAERDLRWARLLRHVARTDNAAV